MEHPMEALPPELSHDAVEEPRQASDATPEMEDTVAASVPDTSPGASSNVEYLAATGTDAVAPAAGQVPVDNLTPEAVPSTTARPSCKSLFQQSSTRVLKIAQMAQISAAEHTRREAEALMQREAHHLDELFFAHRRVLARKNAELYMQTICKDDHRLRVWGDKCIERHLWVEAALRFQAAWKYKRDPSMYGSKEEVLSRQRAAARARIRAELAEIILMRGDVRQCALEFFTQVSSYLARKIFAMRRRLTIITKNEGFGGRG